MIMNPWNLGRWLKVKYPNQWKENKLQGIQELWQEFKKECGSARKFRIYLKDFLSAEDQKLLLEQFQFFPGNGESYFLQDVQEVAQMFYNRRSSFVHQAKMFGLAPSSGPLGDAYNGKGLIVRLNIDVFKYLFEKSFVAFWERTKGELQRVIA